MSGSTFGKYIPLNSPIHYLNPKVKILCFLLTTICIWILKEIEYQIFFFVFSILNVSMSHLSFSYFLKPIGKMKYLFLGIILIEVFFHGFSFTTVALILKVINLMVFSFLYLVTTKQKEIMKGLEFLFSPLTFFHLPIQNFIFLISLTFQFLPNLFYELEKTKKTLICKGIDYEHSNWKEKIKILSFLLSPIVINTMKKADALSEVMELQGFDLKEKRTSYVSYKMHFFDYFYLGFHICMVLVLFGKGVFL